MKNEEYLEHHGVKGMKWGVRKAATSRINSIKRENSWAKESKNARSLSDKELKGKVERLRSENTIRRNTFNKTATLRDPANGINRRTYRERAKYSDKEIKKIAERLDLESEFRKEAANAAPWKKTIAREMIKAASSTPVGTFGPQDAFVKMALKGIKV